MSLERYSLFAHPSKNGEQTIYVYDKSCDTSDKQLIGMIESMNALTFWPLISGVALGRFDALMPALRAISEFMDECILIEAPTP